MWSSFPSRFSWSWGLSRSGQNSPAPKSPFSTPSRNQASLLPPLGYSVVEISIDQYDALLRYFSTACDLEGKTNLHAAMVYVERQIRNNPLFADYNQASKVVHEMSKLDRDNRAHMKEIDVEKFKLCLQETNIRVSKSQQDKLCDGLSDRDKYADLLRQRSQGEFVSLSPRPPNTYGRMKAGMDISSRFEEMSSTLASEEKRIRERREEQKSIPGTNLPSPLHDDERMSTMSDDEADEVPSRYLISRFAEVTAVERAAVQAVYNGPDSDEIIKTKFNIDIRRRDVRRLGPGRWLNDDVINFYMKMLQERDNSLCAQYSSRAPSYFFSSLFMLKLNENDTYNFGNVKRWTKSFNVFEMSRIYFPINVAGSHWTLVVVDVKERRIRYYDSMSGSGHRYVNHIMRWLMEEGRSRHGIEVNQNEWTLQHQGGDDVPQQMNGFDCGVFTTMCADFLSDNLPLRYSQEHMELFRVKIGAAIMRGNVDYPL